MIKYKTLDIYSDIIIEEIKHGTCQIKSIKTPVRELVSGGHNDVIITSFLQFYVLEMIQNLLEKMLPHLTI